MKKLQNLTSAYLSSATLLLLSQSAYGLGLGNIEIQSNLNQPLVAEVKLHDMGVVLASELRVGMASSDAFEKAGIERNYSLTDFRFEIKTHGDEPVVTIRSLEPVKDPFLSFIVEARWASGKVQREYTVLLDPVEMKPIASKPKPKPRAQAKAKKPKPIKASQFYGPVAPNDTLWDIAANLSQSTGAQVEQTMMAIAAKNPDAFVRGNINGLKQKVKLKMPTLEETRQVSLSEAIAKMQEHQIAWRNQTSVAPITLSPPPAQLAQPSKALELITPQTQMVPAQPQAPQVAASQQQPVKNNLEQQQMQQRLMLIEETLDTLRQINLSLQKDQNELKERNQALVAMVEAKEQELLNLKSQSSMPADTLPNQAQILADKPVQMAQPAAQEEPIDPKTGLSHSLLDQITSYTKSVPSIKAKLNNAAQATNAQGQNTLADAGKVSTTVNTTVAATQPASNPDVNVTSHQMPTESSNPWVWLALLLGAGASVGGAYEYLRRFRPEVIEQFKTTKLPFNIPGLSRQDPPLDEQDSDSQADNQQSTEPQSKDQAVIKPEQAVAPEATQEDIEEAFAVFDEAAPKSSKLESETQASDMTGQEASSPPSVEQLMAQQQYDEAETLLGQHLSQYPEDWSHHVKLLEVYQHKNDFDALRNHLNQLPNDLATQAPNEWQAIQTILENSMSQVISGTTPQQQHQPEPETPTEQSTPIEQPSPVATSEPQPEMPMQEPPADESLNLAKQCNVDDNEVQFELDSQSSQDEPLEFVVSTDNQSEHDDLAQTESAEPSQNAYLEEGDDAQTKLALAKAYIDLGDIPLAKEQLNEVLAQGNQAQQEEAKQLLESIEKGDP